MTEGNSHKSQAQYYDIFFAASDALIVTDLNGQIVEANPQATQMIDYSTEELFNKPFKSLLPIQFHLVFDELTNSIIQNQEAQADIICIKKSGTPLDIEIKGSTFNYQGKPHLLLIARDISERKWAEEELKLTNQQLRRSEHNVREREIRLRAILQGSAIGIALVDLNGRYIENNLALQQMLGYSKFELSDKIFTEFTHPKDRESSYQIFQDIVKGKCNHYQLEKRFVHRNGSIIWIRLTASLVRGENETPTYVINMIEDISDRKQTEESLRKTESQYRLLFENMLDAFAYYQIIFDDNHCPVDYVVLEINESFEKITGLKKKQIINRRISEVLPDIKGLTYGWIDIYDKNLLENLPVKFEQYSDQMQKWFAISIYSPQPGYFVTLFEDISQRRQMDEELRNFTTELERSNRELERFAQVVAEDLNQPLNTISNSSKLLEELYQQCASSSTDTDQSLAQNIKDHLDKIFSSANQTQVLLDNLLRYSRLEMEGNVFEDACLDEFLNSIIQSRQNQLNELQATVEYPTALPTVTGDKGQLYQLLDNIIDNAIKFHSPSPLLLSIASQRIKNAWLITITDNGIGIEARQHERAFGMFQRLHCTETYSGSGIGLSIAKKIIERHRGKIWLESAPDKGTTIFFSIPDVD